MKTLIRNELVLSFYFDIEKFCLTAVGEEIAKKLWDDKTNFETDEEDDIKGADDKNGEETTEDSINAQPEPKVTIIPKDIESSKLWIYIDNREIKTSNERSFFHTKLAEHGIPCLLHNLPIGDFLWVLEVKSYICN